MKHATATEQTKQEKQKKMDKSNGEALKPNYF